MTPRFTKIPVTVAVAVSLSLAAFAANATADNLVQDPSFELDQRGGVTFGNYLSAGKWYVGSGSAEVLNYPAPDGNQYAELGYPGTSSLEQHLAAVTAGQGYDISFYLEDTPGTALTVQFGSTFIPIIQTPGSFTEVTLKDVIAPSSGLFLNFVETGGSPDIDDVIVTPANTPAVEGSTLALVGVGLSLAGALKRKTLTACLFPMTSRRAVNL